MNAIYGKRQICDTCPQIAFKTFDGIHYLQAVDGGGGNVVATPTQASTWETFRLVQFTNLSNYTGLQSLSGRWMAAVNGGGAGVIATANYLGPWETFYMSNDASGHHLGTFSSTPSMPRKYVVAENGGGGTVNADRPVASTWETFKVETKVAGNSEF